MWDIRVGHNGKYWSPTSSCDHVLKQIQHGVDVAKEEVWKDTVGHWEAVKAWN